MCAIRAYTVALKPEYRLGVCKQASRQPGQLTVLKFVCLQLVG